MSLISAKEMYKRSFQSNFSLAAFNVFNLESLYAVVSACEELGSPAFVQMAMGGRRYMVYDQEFFQLTKNVLANSSIPFVLHHDHISSVDAAKAAIDLGFTSIMFDGSALSYQENIARTKEVVDYGKGVVCVEAELGKIPGFEDDVFADKASYTDATLINDFIDQSGCTSLAVSVGTAHGGVLSEEHLPLDFDTLAHILKQREHFPFVLHGAASMPEALIKAVNEQGANVPSYRICSEADITKACRMGIKKANMDVDNFLCFTANARKFLNENKQAYDPRKYLSAARNGFKDEVKHKLTNVVQSAGVIL